LVVSRTMGVGQVRLPLRLRQACLVVMLLNMASGGGLMGNLQIRPFPFLRNPNPAIVAASSVVSARARVR